MCKIEKPLTQSGTTSRWPHRLAVALVCATFPLIWVGGLVTTHEAGMAVPDWPTTYGYSMFSYPWQSWLAGPWDLLVEHGHRQLGAVVGFITLTLLGVVCWQEPRRWVKAFAGVCCLAVIGQGLLGGLRVLRDDGRLAMVHGITGPLFFALTVGMAAVCSRWWQQLGDEQRSESNLNSAMNSSVPLPGAWILVALAVSQLVLGAQLRHAPYWGSHATFRVMVVFHLLTAIALLIQVSTMSWRLRSRPVGGLLRRPATGLLVLVGLQVGLGLATWVVKYGWPIWSHDYRFAAGFTVQAQSLTQSIVVTAHVATGSLILVTSLLLALRVSRWSYVRRSWPAQDTSAVHLLTGVLA